MRIIPLMDNRTAHSGCKAEHGLSLYIETMQNGSMLPFIFDLGPSVEIVKNARRLHVDLKRAQHIVISHGHYDHGGLLADILKELNEDVKVYLHRRAFEESYFRNIKKVQLYSNRYKMAA